MKETWPRRTGSDHEYVERISARTARLLAAVAAVLPHEAAAVIAGLVAVHHASGIGSIIGYAVYAAILRLSIGQIGGPLALRTAVRARPAIAGVILAIPSVLVLRTALTILDDEPPAIDRNHP